MVLESTQHGGLRCQSHGLDLKSIYGYLRLEGRISSSWIFSRRFLEVACLDLEALAEKQLDEFLQFLNLFFLLLVGFLHLTDHQLAGLIPEIVVAA